MRPLAGLFVLDLTRLLPGPYATAILAELGARVVKVEEPGPGDYARWLPPEVEPDAGALFATLNRGKESMVANLKTPEGVEIVRRLAARADVLVEGFRPGVLDRLGLGAEGLSAANPRLVQVSLSGYGRSGPLADAVGHDLNYESLAGLLDLAGAEGGPVVPAVQAADMGGAFYAVIAILAALHERQRTGRGRVLDVSLHDAALAINGFNLLRGAREGRNAPGRGEGELVGGLPNYNVYACSDGRWLALGALEPKFWDRFCAATKREDLAPLALAAGDREARAEVARLFAARPRDEWLADLGAAGVPATPVLRPEETLAHPHVRARTGGLAPTPGFPLTGAPASIRAPRLGEHTDAVLLELGYDEAAMRRLRESGAVA